MYHFHLSAQQFHPIIHGFALYLSHHIGAMVRVVLLFAAASVVSCDQRPAIFTDTERRHADSVVSTARGVDGLRRLQQRLYATGDRLGSIVALRELGRELRNESRFEEALRVHSEGLRQAETVADTTEWIQALNNIGTDYRRMGILDVAQEYHYNAWQLSEAHADTTFSAQKNLVMSLNGLGNVYLAMGNYPRADSMFRLALRGERLLRSTVGQAINYANLGAIFEHRGQLDSAWTYYRMSMQHNREAGSTLGIALCHTYYGSLYEKSGQYGKA